MRVCTVWHVFQVVTNSPAATTTAPAPAPAPAPGSGSAPAPAAIAVFSPSSGSSVVRVRMPSLRIFLRQTDSGPVAGPTLSRRVFLSQFFRVKWLVFCRGVCRSGTYDAHVCGALVLTAFFFGVGRGNRE